MLKTTLADYIDVVCPDLSLSVKQKLVRELFKMTIGWASQHDSKGQQTEYLRQASRFVRQKFGLASRAYDVELHCRKGDRSAEEVSSTANSYLKKLVTKTRRKKHENLQIPLPIFNIERIEIRQPDLAIVHTKISGKGLQERDIRRAFDLARPKRQLRLRLAEKYIKPTSELKTAPTAAPATV